MTGEALPCPEEHYAVYHEPNHLLMLRPPRLGEAGLKSSLHSLLRLPLGVHAVLT